MFYTIMLPILYWTINRRKAVKLGIIFLLTAIFNDILKEIFQNPRPDPAYLLEGINNLSLKFKPHSPGFPSGHTQCTLAFFGMLFYLFKSKYIRILSVAAIILVPYSRIYLGVHFAGDVVGGYVFGALMLLLIPVLIYIEKNLNDYNKTILYLLIFTFSILMFSITPNHAVNKFSGVLAGFLIGAILSVNKIDFNPNAGLKAALIKSICGLIVLLGLQSGIKVVFPDTAIAGYLRYWIMGFWVSFIAPLIFSKFALLKGKKLVLNI